MGSTEKPDLLFFDTFSHDTSEELNLDLVQFPKSVHVREIRIIPLGARVEGDFPGGVRLGATNPTKFHIDFFVNDLSKPGASTFESLGSLDYCQNGQIHMECGAGEEDRIPTDGLVLRGWYTTITLAVYGNLTQVITDVAPVCANPPVAASIEVPPVVQEPPPPQEWPAETANPIPTYTGNVAAVNPDAYGPNYPENYDNQMYRQEYYDNDAPKDPRTYHHGDTEWDRERRISVEREPERRHSPRSLDDRDRDRKSRRRSRSRSSRRREHIRSRSRSRDRDYIIKGEYRPMSRSRSRSIDPRDRIRGMSGDRDWDRGSYKKDDYRRHRDSSYDRSRAGSYDKRSGSYDRRSRSYEKRTPSYERKPYDKRGSPYDKRSGSYERRAPSYEKQSYDKKRHSPYRRGRGSSYSRSPSRDDPRKRPRSPPGETTRRPLSPGKSSPINSIRSDDGEYSAGKQIPRVEFYHSSYRHKTSIRSPSQEPENPPFIETQHSSLVTVPLVETTPGANNTIESPRHTPDDDKSVDAEQFEPILSDEDICDDLEAPYMEVDYDLNDYEGVEDIIKYYNPFKSEWVRYQNVNKIQYVAPRRGDDVKDVMNATFDELCDVSTDLFKLSEITQTAKGREQKFIASTFKEIDNVCREEWVHQCEQIYVCLTNLCKESDIVLRLFHERNRNDNDEFKDIFDLLITFCRIGLNFDFALCQQQPTYKIRHMKCGIRLVEALFSHSHSDHVMKMVLESGLDVTKMLLEMYSKDYMALSIRLMILKSLNACLSSKTGVEHFMKPSVYPKFDKNDNENKLKNGYQALITMMKTNPLGRIKFSISALIKKLNMYELLGKLYETIHNFSKKSADSPETEDIEFSETDTDFLVDAIEEILYMYRSQCFHISQPKRFLPVSAQFEINKDCSNEVLLQYFHTHHLLEVCLFLLTCPSTSSNLVVISPVYDLIHELIHSENGINFLYKNMEMSELLFKTLMQPYTPQNAEEFLYPHDLSSYGDLQILGLELAYRLKCLYYLDSICDVQAGEPNDNELIDRLQSLYCLSFGCIGKVAVPDIIVMGNNAECLMEVFEKTTRIRSKNDSPSKQKSPAKGYAVELIAAAMRFSAHVPFMKKYATRLINVTKDHDKFEPSVSSILQEISPYLKPIENTTLLSGDDMADCIEILKVNLEHAPDLPGELTTCLRVLRHYCISDYHSAVSIANESPTDEYVELKYKYNVLQLFSLDGVSHLSAILDRLAVRFEQPSIHTSFFASMKGLQLAQIIVPCVRLLDEMLARVVKCRGSRFRDMTAAPILLKTYGIVKTFPIGCVGYRTAAKAAEATVRALLAYCQPIADDASDKDSIRRGPWTTLSSEVISYTMTAPYTFVSGLLVFSELLPLPLPMQTKIPPTETELSDALNERRMWSAHLHALSNDLTDMIQVICMSTYRPVVHMLRRVCIQIADLAPNTAATVAKAAIGAVMRELKEKEAASASAARVFSFLACMVAHAPVKCAIVHALNTGGPRGEDVQAAVCRVLGASHTSTEHAAAQEVAAHALAGLCDVELTLTPPTTAPETIIANSLPNPESLAALLDSAIDCLAFDTKTTTVTSAILRAFFVLTEHEYGFQQFKKLLPKRHDSLGKFFKWALEGPGEDKAECLGLYIDLIRILRMEEGEGPVGRKSTLSVSEMADMVGYTAGDADHPVLSLEKTLKERTPDDESNSVTNNVTFLTSQLSQLRAESPSPPSPGEATPANPPPAANPPPPPPSAPSVPTALAAQFGSRSVRAAGDAGDERLTSGFWLDVPPVADDDFNEQDCVVMDVSAVSAGLLGGCGVVGVGGGAGGGGAGAGGAALWPRRLPPGHLAASHATAHHTQPLVVVRGRAEGADVFRSRPPNTSRPPSLHVDDFTRANTYTHHARGGRRGMANADRGRFATHHYRQLRGRGAWEQHFGHFAPQPYGMAGAMGWGGGRMQRPRHRSFMR